MMNVTAIVGIAFWLTMTATFAKEATFNQASVHELAFDGCHFKFSDPYHARISTDMKSATHSASYIANINPKARHPFETWIHFRCENPATSKTYLESASIKLTPHGWILDTSKEDPNFPSPRTTFYALYGKSWHGGGTTQDETDGDEDKRTRAFNFCIPHNKLALCGSIQSVSYLSYPDESTLPQVIRLLESIEFIDRPPAPHTDSVSPSSSQ
ncbi:hypothetical protein [Burkholderia ambifaria]|uniref:hypothetical protein n=1 Tax=Burkholderia ambifaria TaxID=152480 RepID=UPI00158CB7EC|nr:hypothetical protein [Burkholderia ambifaria]